MSALGQKQTSENSAHMSARCHKRTCASLEAAVEMIDACDRGFPLGRKPGLNLTFSMQRQGELAPRRNL